jgi:RND family efflux transporter MFP subunit
MVAVAVSACTGNSPAAKVEEARTEAALPVTVVPVRIQAVQRTIEGVGTLFAHEEVTIASEVQGRIAKLAVDMGDRVTQGQVLGVIADTEFRLAVEEAKESLGENLAKLGLERLPPPNFDVRKTSLVLRAQAELDDARTHSKRLAELHRSNLISAQERDTAATRVATAHATYNSAVEEAKALIAVVGRKAAQLAMAHKKLRDTIIAAPLTGAISERRISPGEYVEVGDPLFTLVQDHPLKFRVRVPERFTPIIRIGQQLELHVDAFPGRTFVGRLTRINPSAEVATRAFLIEGEVGNEEHLLKPNFFAHVRILTHTDPQAVTAPQQAMVTFAGVTKVFVIEDGIARERQVQTGVRVGDNDVEIMHGLKAGELVAIRGLTRLTDGLAVEWTQNNDTDGQGPPPSTGHLSPLSHP